MDEQLLSSGGNGGDVSPRGSDISPSRYWCHQCSKVVTLSGGAISCPECSGGFIEDLWVDELDEPPVLVQGRAHRRPPRILRILELLRSAVSQSGPERPDPTLQLAASFSPTELLDTFQEEEEEEEEEEEDDDGEESSNSDGNRHQYLRNTFNNILGVRNGIQEEDNDEEEDEEEEDEEEAAEEEDEYEEEEEETMRRGGFLRVELNRQLRRQNTYDSFLAPRRRRRNGSGFLSVGHIESEHESESEQNQRQRYLRNMFDSFLGIGGRGGEMAAVAAEIHDDYLDAQGFEQLLLHLAENDNTRRGAPPASKSAIDSLPLVVVDKFRIDNGSASCAVCKETSDPGTPMKQLPCLHLYHPECILPWLSFRNSCPVCRFELPTDDPDYEDSKRPTCPRLLPPAPETSTNSELNNNSEVAQSTTLENNNNSNEAIELHESTQHSELNPNQSAPTREGGDGGGEQRRGGWLHFAAASPVFRVMGFVFVLYLGNHFLNVRLNQPARRSQRQLRYSQALDDISDQSLSWWMAPFQRGSS